MKRAVRERREKVSTLLLKNMTEVKIAETLGYVRQTIVRDVSFFRKSSQNWLEGLAKDGVIYEYQQTLFKVKATGYEYQKLYENTNDVWQKIAILRAIDANNKLYLELLAGTPTIHAYRKATKEERVS